MKHKPKILIIEDNKHNHKLYRDVFERAGFEVLIHQNADGYLAEGVDKIKPDIISMDLMIGAEGSEQPERDGFQAIEALKGDLRTHEIPIMVMTSFSEESKARRAKELGAVDYMSLPGHSITKIPHFFMEYLKDPKRYKASHPLFRKT